MKIYSCEVYQHQIHTSEYGDIQPMAIELLAKIYPDKK